MTYYYAKPLGWTSEYPLIWDMAHHYLGATQFADGVRHLDWRTLRTALQGADSYPPFHSAALGSWFVLFGSGVTSWLVFGFLVCAGTALLLFRIGGLFSVLAFAVSPMLVSLTTTLLLDSFAAMMALATILLIPQPASGGKVVPTWRFVAFGAALTATILTKYNYGLPLFAVAIFVTCLSRSKRLIVGVIFACAAAIALLAGFLTWMDNGWSTFKNHVVNRSSGQLTPPDRLEWYGRHFVEFYAGSLPMAIALVGLTVIGGLWVVVRQRPWAAAVHSTRLVACLAVVGGTVIVMGLHELLQVRNLVLPSLAIIASAGAVVKLIPLRARWACLALAVVLCVTNIAFGKVTPQTVTEGWYSSKSRQLAGLSEAVSGLLQQRKPTRVVGTFAQFGSDWVTILRNRNAPGVFVGTDPPYPLKSSRTKNSDQWSEKYSEIVAKWHVAGVKRIIGIEIQSGSIFDGPDYQSWGLWKKNLILAARESPDYYLAQSTSFESGVNLYVFDAK